MPDRDASLDTRIEIPKKCAAGYRARSSKDKFRILNQLAEMIGTNREQARQQLRRRIAQLRGRASATVAVINRRNQ